MRQAIISGSMAPLYAGMAKSLVYHAAQQSSVVAVGWLCAARCA